MRDEKLAFFEGYHSSRFLESPIIANKWLGPHFLTKCSPNSHTYRLLGSLLASMLDEVAVLRGAAAGAIGAASGAPVFSTPSMGVVDIGAMGAMGATGTAKAGELTTLGVAGKEPDPAPTAAVS